MTQSQIGPDLVALLPRLRRYALTLTRSPALADDLVQGACERALAHAASWQVGTRFDAWVFRILRNLWIDWARRSQIQERSGLDEAEAVPDLLGERLLVDRLRLKDVLDAMERLPDEQREVLTLACIEDLAYREVAEIVDVPIGTVMSRLARARRRLAELIDGDGEGETSGTRRPRQENGGP